MPTRSPARWSAPWTRPAAAAKSRWPTTTANGITPESVKSRISDILDSRLREATMSAPTSRSSPSCDGAMVGNNLKAHLEALEKQMRDAAADLDFETAARLRDEIKRLREMELSDLRRSARPLRRIRKPGLGPREGQAQQGPRHPPRGRRKRAEQAGDPHGPARRGRQDAVRQAVDRRHGPGHGCDEAGRCRVTFAVQEAVACRGAWRRLWLARRCAETVPQELARRDDGPPHRKTR